jgi:hypothetical protein
MITFVHLPCQMPCCLPLTAINVMQHLVSMTLVRSSLVLMVAMMADLIFASLNPSHLCTIAGVDCKRFWYVPQTLCAIACHCQEFPNHAAGVIMTGSRRAIGAQHIGPSRTPPSSLLARSSLLSKLVTSVLNIHYQHVQPPRIPTPNFDSSICHPKSWPFVYYSRS